MVGTFFRLASRVIEVFTKYLVFCKYFQKIAADFHTCTTRAHALPINTYEDLDSKQTKKN